MAKTFTPEGTANIVSNREILHEIIDKISYDKIKCEDKDMDLPEYLSNHEEEIKNLHERLHVMNENMETSINDLSDKIEFVEKHTRDVELECEENSVNIANVKKDFHEHEIIINEFKKESEARFKSIHTIGILVISLIIIIIGYLIILDNRTKITENANNRPIIIDNIYESEPQIERVEDIDSGIHYIFVIDDDGERHIIYQYRIEK